LSKGNVVIGLLSSPGYWVHLAGTCPASPVLQDGVKGHNMNETTLPGSPAL